MDGVNEAGENGKFSNLLDPHEEKQTLDESRKSGQTSGTKWHFTLSQTKIYRSLVFRRCSPPIKLIR
ncbi:hypothetical protein Hanom_Chr02g00135981 [Helianthus anomalus]